MARDEREKLWREYRRGRFIYGSRQQLAMHPVFGAIRALDAEITALEDRFGLNPRARARLGLTFVQATRTLADVNAAIPHRAPDDEQDPRIEIEGRDA